MNIPYACDRMPLRIGMLMDHPSAHMVALLEAVAGQRYCTLEVLYCGQSAPGRGWDTPVGCVPHEFVSGFTGPMGIRFNPGIFRAMNRLNIDVWIVNSIYGSITTLMAVWWLHFHRRPWVYMNEPIRPRSGIHAILKELPLRYILDRADGIIGTGKSAVERYRQRLRKDLPSESVPYFIDVSGFLDLPNPIAPESDQELQFVTLCRLVEGKGLDCLLQACEKLPPTGWHLTLIGEGPLRSRLEGVLEKRNLLERVTFLGAIPYSKRAKAFAGRHVFVFPSLWDGWGMVVPEALASGLPVISTNCVTSAHEFIRNGENGFIIPAGDSVALANKMQWFMRETSSYLEMSDQARKSISNYRSDLGAGILVSFLRRLSDGIAQKQVSEHSSAQSEGLTWRFLTTPQNPLEKTKHRLRRIGKKTIIRSSVLARRPQKAKGHSIIAYHLVLKEDRQNFEDHLRFFRDYFRISSLRELLQAATSDDSSEFRLAITFDDGFRLLTQDCLEILQKYGVKAGFYIPAAFINSKLRNASTEEFSARSFYYSYPLEPMSPKDLEQLAALGHEIGSHGLFHTNVHSMTPEAAERELTLSRSMITDWTGVAPVGYAYPYGGTSNAQGNPADWLQKAGFAYGLTLARGTVDSSTNHFVLPRHHAEGNWPIHELRYFLFA